MVAKALYHSTRLTEKRLALFPLLSLGHLLISFSYVCRSLSKPTCTLQDSSAGVSSRPFAPDHSVRASRQLWTTPADGLAQSAMTASPAHYAHAFRPGRYDVLRSVI